MRAVWWFRIATLLFLLFAVGHSVGFLSFRPPTAEGLAVWGAMNDVHFTVGHSTYSYGGFYIGFGLFVTAADLFLAWLAWQLGSMAQRGSFDARAIAWGLAALQLVSAGLSVRFFSIGPVVLSALAAACLATGAFSVRRFSAPVGS
jgi:hypothetical protein